MKKPEAGEWMQSGAERARVVGFRLDGWAVLELKNGFICAVKSLEEYDVLPYCTGWDWQPEVFPQWYVRPQGFGGGTAFLLRSIPSHYDCIDKHGVRQCTTEWGGDEERYVRAGAWKKVEKEQAEALLAPVESPDDWVTQDVVVRRHGVDQCRWVSSVATTPWRDVREDDIANCKHGYADHVSTLEVRCRRKDLPKIEPKTKRVPVRLYWYDGNIVGRYDHSQPTDESFNEIKSDGNGGWYVEALL